MCARVHGNTIFPRALRSEATEYAIGIQVDELIEWRGVTLRRTGWEFCHY